MITKDLCVKIWNAHNEIEKSEALIKTMADELAKNPDNEKLEIPDWTGNKEGLKLGLPSGSSGHYIFNVSPKLAMGIIEEHISSNKKRLEELMTLAKIQVHGY